MAKKSDEKKADAKKLARKRKKLIKRLAEDLDSLLKLIIESGDSSAEAIGTVLTEVGKVLEATEAEHGADKHLRKAGRFLADLNVKHGTKIPDGQLEKEFRDQRNEARIFHLTEAGRTPAEIARELRKEGHRITADGIRRILAGEG